MQNFPGMRWSGAVVLWWHLWAPLGPVWMELCPSQLGWKQKMVLLIPSTGNQVKYLMDIFNICCEIASDSTLALVWKRSLPDAPEVIYRCRCCSCHPPRALLLLEELPLRGPKLRFRRTHGLTLILQWKTSSSNFNLAWCHWNPQVWGGS